ncbi:MAG: hypothetical protein E7527_01695 [Ruminococcaceae bacterium]|nr:hypothetical protein [Oscillospiraceae bacterium]
MRKVCAVFICMILAFSFSACSNNDNSAFSENESGADGAFTEIENQAIRAKDGTEYINVGLEYEVWCLGEWEFIGHVAGEKKEFSHLSVDNKIKTGMYSVGGKQDVLVRYFPDNEFPAVYVRSDLLKTEIVLENCIRFAFLKEAPRDNAQATFSNKSITECEQFLNEIKSGQTAEEAGLYDLVRQPSGILNNCYIYGYVCGVVQEDINVVIPLEVKSFDDKAYSITLDDVEYVLNKKWLDKLTME